MNAQAENPHGMGISIGGVYLSDDEKIAPGLQLEYEYHFSIGQTAYFYWFAAENVFTHERHISFATGFGFDIFENFSLNIGPGLVMHGEKLMFSAVLGLERPYCLGRFSLGPVMEIAYIGNRGDHSHYMLGLNIGYSFSNNETRIMH